VAPSVPGAESGAAISQPPLVFILDQRHGAAEVASMQCASVTASLDVDDGRGPVWLHLVAKKQTTQTASVCATLTPVKGRATSMLTA
jgi:hypothetical protein